MNMRTHIAWPWPPAWRRRPVSPWPPTRPGAGPARHPHAALDALLLKPLKARSIGPAVMGGRVADVALDPKDPFTFYVALGTGGLMKTHGQRRLVRGRLRGPAGGRGGGRRRRALGSQGRLGGHRRGERPQQLELGQRRVPLDGRRRDRGRTRGSRTARPSRASSSIRPTRPRPGWRRWATSGGPGGERGCFKTTDGGKTWKAVAGRRQALRREGRLRRPGDRSGGAGHGLRRALRAPADALVVRRTAPATPTARTWAASSRPPTAARPGASSTRACPGRPAASAWPYTRRTRASSTPRCRATRAARAASTSVRSRARRHLPLRGRRRDAGRRVNALNPRPFYFSKIRVDPENPQVVYVLGYAAARLRRRGQDVPRGPLRQGAPRRARAGHRPAQPQAPAPRHRRRRLPELQRRRDLGAPEPDGRRRVLPDQRGPVRALPHLRRAAGQPELGGPEPHADARRASSTPTGSTSAAATGSTACSIPTDPDVVYAESQQGYLHRMNLRSGAVEAAPAGAGRKDSPRSASTGTPR